MKLSRRLEMEVINIGDTNKKRKKKDLLEVVDKFREMVDNDEIEEFVIASMDSNGEVNIHVNIKDLIGGVGLYEVGKHILIQQQSLADYE